MGCGVCISMRTLVWVRWFSRCGCQFKVVCLLPPHQDCAGCVCCDAMPRLPPPPCPACPLPHHRHIPKHPPSSDWRALLDLVREDPSLEIHKPSVGATLVHVRVHCCVVLCRKLD